LVCCKYIHFAGVLPFILQSKIRFENTRLFPVCFYACIWWVSKTNILMHFTGLYSLFLSKGYFINSRCWWSAWLPLSTVQVTLSTYLSNQLDSLALRTWFRNSYIFLCFEFYLINIFLAFGVALERFKSNLIFSFLLLNYLWCLNNLQFNELQINYVCISVL
jgi:hypothetical protein